MTTRLLLTLLTLIFIVPVYPKLGAFRLQSTTSRAYQDPQGRFSFSYPSTFGNTSPGTNDGFRDRLAAISFSTFPARFKGEAVLTRGFPLIDLQAVGGLYDSLTLEIFPEPLRSRVVSTLPRLTPQNFCGALEQVTHVDTNLTAFASLAPTQRQAIGQADMMRNANPHVIECQVRGDLVVFDKERSFGPGTPAQHVFGAVRFLPEPFSTFQLVAGGDAPAGLLRAVAELVASFSASNAPR